MLRPEPTPLAAAALAVLSLLLVSGPLGRAAAAPLVGSAREAPPAPIWIQVGTAGAAEGHTQLAWSMPEWQPPEDSEQPIVWGFELQESSDPQFEHALERYRGPQRACFVSGLPDGTWFWRVRLVALDWPAEAGETPHGPWSEVRSLEVRHHPLALAWGLFALGAVLVAAILVFLGLADRRERRGEGA